MALVIFFSGCHYSYLPASVIEDVTGGHLRGPVHVALLSKTSFERRLDAPVPCHLGSGRSSRLAFGLESTQVLFDESSRTAHLPGMMPPLIDHRSGGLRVAVERDTDRRKMLFRVLFQLHLSLLDANFLGSQKIAALDSDACWAAIAFRGAAAQLLTHFTMWQLGSNPDLYRIRNDNNALESKELSASDSDLPAHALLVFFLLMDSFKVGLAVHDVGGIPLVLRSVLNPPVSTEQILHPEKFLAGELPVPVASPATLPMPTGWRPIESGHLGELAIRSIFFRCKSVLPGTTAGTGWGGDSYTVFEDSAHHLALLWITTWDSVQDAKNFGAYLRRGSACLLGDPSTTKLFTSPGFWSQMAGQNFGVIRGISQSDAKGLMDSLLGLVGPPLPNAPPLARTK